MPAPSARVVETREHRAFLGERVPVLGLEPIEVCKCITRRKCPKIPASYKVSNVNKKEFSNVFQLSIIS